MILYEDDKYILKIDKSISTIFALWIDVDSLTDEKYQEILKQYVAAVEKEKPHNILIDTQNGFYPLNDALKEWNRENVCKPIEKTDVKKIAFVIPDSIIIGAPFENYVSKLNLNSKITRKIFTSYNKALQWLLEN